jgi:hypothetical protein
MEFHRLSLSSPGSVVGLDDSLYISRGQLAKSNAEQVAKMRRLVEEFGYQIAAPKLARSAHPKRESCKEQEITGKSPWGGIAVPTASEMCTFYPCHGLCISQQTRLRRRETPAHLVAL